jgi:putative ABC transport system substrate-binding protein
MNKKILVSILAVVIVAFVHLAEAQRPKKVFRIGFLAGSSENNLRGLRQGLRELGYVEGKNITIDSRVAEGKFDRFPRPCRRAGPPQG